MSNRKRKRYLYWQCTLPGRSCPCDVCKQRRKQWAHRLAKEIALFPADRIHDDYMDSISYGLAWKANARL